MFRYTIGALLHAAAAVHVIGPVDLKLVRLILYMSNTDSSSISSIAFPVRLLGLTGVSITILCET